MFGEVLSDQAVKELKARIQRAEQARRVKKACTSSSGKQPSKRKNTVQMRHPWPATAKVIDPQ